MAELFVGARGITCPLLLDQSCVVNLSRCSRPLSHICDSGLGRLTSMECALRLSFVEPVRVVHIDEVQLFEFRRGKRRGIELRLGERGLGLEVVAALLVVVAY